jgi:hypothetical protein
MSKTKGKTLRRQIWWNVTNSRVKTLSSSSHAVRRSRVYLRLILSMRAVIMLLLHETSLIPPCSQACSCRTRTCRTLPRLASKQRILLAGLMCKNRDSQFVWKSRGPGRAGFSPSESTSKPEMMDEVLKLSVNGLLARWFEQIGKIYRTS